jgi:hypothetical protein
VSSNQIDATALYQFVPTVQFQGTFFLSIEIFELEFQAGQGDEIAVSYIAHKLSVIIIFV